MTKNNNSEYGVDSRYLSKKEKAADGKALMEARLLRMQNVSDYDIVKAKLLQLKLRMDEFIKSPVHKNQNYFTGFLTAYIDTIYTRRNLFAKDIDIKPVRLSQVLNNHRDPKEEFILRLMIHSEKIYENICAFNKEIWFQAYYHEKICDTLSSLEEWRPHVEKHVSHSKLIEI